MKKYDWSKFNKRINIKLDEVKIFDALTSQNNIEKWFLSQAQFYTRSGESKDRFSNIEQGDTYEWMWHGSDDVAKGEVLSNNGKDHIEFTFLGCKVSIQVKQENGENIVELIQSDIALDEHSRMSDYVGCSRGWTFYLTNLKSILEGGIDLRNRNNNLIDVINT